MDVIQSVKLGFSLALGSAALYVLLSNKYPPRVQKWAIGTLGAVAIVWVGQLPH